MKKPKYCCKGLRTNLNDKCSQHGWLCPDNLLYLKEKNGKTEVIIPDVHDEGLLGLYWRITHCPFCGKIIEFLEDGESGTCEDEDYVY